MGRYYYMPPSRTTPTHSSFAICPVQNVALDIYASCRLTTVAFIQFNSSVMAGWYRAQCGVAKLRDSADIQLCPQSSRA